MKRRKTRSTCSRLTSLSCEILNQLSCLEDTCLLYIIQREETFSKISRHWTFLVRARMTWTHGKPLSSELECTLRRAMLRAVLQMGRSRKDGLRRVELAQLTLSWKGRWRPSG